MTGNSVGLKICLPAERASPMVVTVRSVHVFPSMSNCVKSFMRETPSKHFTFQHLNSTVHALCGMEGGVAKYALVTPWVDCLMNLKSQAK